MTQQSIALSYKEQILVQLSVAQNGACLLTTAHDDSGTRTGYISQYPIDLSGYDAALAAQNAADLIAYANAKQTALENGGVTVNVAQSGQPAKNIVATTDVAGRTNLGGLVSLAQMSSDFVTVWVQASGTVTLNASEIVALGVAVGAFVQATYAALSRTLTAIANGTIHTQADIDSTSWPMTTIDAPASGKSNANSSAS